jgi:hypothetical protein
MINPNFFNGLIGEANELVGQYSSPEKNPNQIESKPDFESLFITLQKHCLPIVSNSVEESRNKYRNLPANSSLKNIVDAIRIHTNEVNQLPKTDDDNKPIYDDHGKTSPYPVDYQFLTSTTAAHLSKNGNDVAKQHFYMEITKSNNINFKTLLTQMEQFVQNSIHTTSIHNNTSTDTNTITLPKSSPAGDNNKLDPLSILSNFAGTRTQPIRVTHGQHCKNCNEFDHYTSDCANSHCGTCNLSFPDLESRLRHASVAHSRNTRTQHGNRSRSRNSDNRRFERHQRDNSQQTHNQYPPHDNNNGYDRNSQNHHHPRANQRLRSRSEESNDSNTSYNRSSNPSPFSNRFRNTRSPGRKSSSPPNNKQVSFNHNYSTVHRQQETHDDESM